MINLCKKNSQLEAVATLVGSYPWVTHDGHYWLGEGSGLGSMGWPIPTLTPTSMYPYPLPLQVAETPADP